MDYDALTMKNVPENVRNQIQLDLHRTCEQMNEDANMAMLERVLLAFAAHNPIIGYCQSFNFIAAMLLLQCSEVRAFWVFAALIEDEWERGGWCWHIV